MQIFILSLICLALIESVLFYFLIKLNRTDLIDREMRPIMVLTANYVDYFWAPIGIYVLSLLVLSALIPGNMNLPFIILLAFSVTLYSTFLIVKKSFRRFYFTELGLEVLYLATNKFVRFDFSQIKRAGVKKKISSSSYFVEVADGQISFSRNQLADVDKFKNYFLSRSIGFYTYDSGTGQYVQTY